LGVITNVQPQMEALGPSTRPNWKTAQAILFVGAIAVCSSLALLEFPDFLMWEALRVLAIGLLLFFLFVWSSRLPMARPTAAFVIWGLVLASEGIFFRSVGDYANLLVLQGKFPGAAYGEVLSNICCLVLVLLFGISTRQYFSRLFSGDYKWLTLFAMTSLASCAYSPRPSYALAWAIKLSLVVLLIGLCSTQIHEFRDTVSFLRYSLWGYIPIVLVPVILGFFQPSAFDEEGRMSPIVSPNALGPDAGVVFLLALTLYSRVKHEGLRKAAILIGSAAFVVMILAGSKTGILGAVIGGAFFFGLRKRVGSAVGYIAIAIVLICVLAVSTPLGSYFSHYEDSGQAGSFTGRTLLWSAVLPSIRQKPILGHGYLASTFVGIQVNAVQWDAPQLHNGFLEALYNEGLLGLIPVLMIHVVIIRNLIRVLRRASSDGGIYRIATGCFALYVHLLINGFFNASFGGKPRPSFILLMGLVLVSNKLFELVSPSSAYNLTSDLKTKPVGTGGDLLKAPAMNTVG